MNYDSVTEKVQKLINDAYNYASENSHALVNNLHILKALLKAEKVKF